GYDNSSLNVDDRVSDVSVDTYHLGAYAGAQWKGFGLRAGVAYAWHDVGATRSVVFPGFFERQKSDYQAATSQVFGEVDYRIQAGRVAVTPFAGLAYVNLHVDGFAEDGAKAGLRADDSNQHVTYSTLGVRAASTFALGAGMSATVRGTLGWRHAFGSDVSDARVAFAGGSRFTVAGVPIAKDVAVLRLGVGVDVTKSANLALSYSGQWSG